MNKAKTIKAPVGAEHEKRNSLGVTKQQMRIVVILLAGTLLVVLNQMLLTPALPRIMHDLQVDATTVQWLTSAYAMVEAVMIPLSAWFMGRFSTRQMFIGWMCLFLAGTTIACLAPNFAVLLSGRVVQAMSTGVLMVMVNSLVLLTFPKEKRGTAMGIVSLVIAFAPAVGPSVGGVLVDLVGWRAVFGVVMVLAAIVIVCAIKILKNQDVFPQTHFDVPSVVFSTLGLAPMLYGLSTFASGNTLVSVALIVVGLVFIALFAWRQLHLSQPMLELTILKSRRYRTTIITMMFLQAVGVGAGVIMPLYTQNVLGYSAALSGVLALPGALAGAVIGLLAGRVFDRHGVRGISLVGGVLVFCGGLWTASFGVDSVFLYVMFGNLVMASCQQFLMTPINTWGVNSLDNSVVQHATAVTNTMGQVAGSFGTAIIMSFSAIGSSLSTATGVQNVYDGYHLSMIAMAVITGIVLFMIVCFVRDRKNERSTAAAASAAYRVSDPNLSVASVMDREFLTVPVTATLGQAARILADSGMSGLPVLNDDGSVAGFVSSSDILKLLGEDALSYTSTGALMGSSNIISVVQAYDNDDIRDHIAKILVMNVMEVATKKVISTSSDVSYGVAITTLAHSMIKELPVIDDGKLVGILRRSTLMDMVARIVEEEEEGGPVDTSLGEAHEAIEQA